MQSSRAGVRERVVFVLRLIFLPMVSIALFGMLLGVSVMAVFFGRSLPRAVEYIVSGGLVLVGWGALHSLLFLFFHWLAQRAVIRRSRARLGEVAWARQAWWQEDGQRVLGLVAVAPGKLLVAPFGGEASACFEDVRAVELLPAGGPLQLLLGHGPMRVFRANGETWEALVCGSRRALQTIRGQLGVEAGAAEQAEGER